ncbi:ATP-binding protein [Pedobacter sp. CFBP9032]|uniref:ATP-binding protein n=1 Tax=Pedobacter sp. CFBP9032 TaxID=3096539 RepID=UPI002A6B74A8|nr:ATP-binding protein [Pedobacter sp. CFBP9032]MDY0906861.1 ATP-binding protein [Pedobacter sp. CFBP9032]
MIQRIGKNKLKQLASKFRVVAVVGPRQSGKTTICKATFPRKPYVSLENPDIADFAITDPNGFLRQFKNGAILDEVQKLPHLFSYIQQIVDENNKAGFFILSGSNNFLMQESISQTLAGRVAYLHLLPCSLKELKTAKLLSSYENHIFNGGYPEPLYKNITATDWYPNYINTYVERDVRQLKNITNLVLFMKFLRLCAGRTGQILNMQSLGNDCGIDAKTVQAWLNILESSYIIYLLKPFYNNYNKRIIKAPKLYFYDTAIVCSLLGIQNKEQLKSHSSIGALFENMVIIDLLKQRLNNGSQDNLYYWRDKTGNELDVLLDTATSVTAIEIKAGATMNADYQKGLLYFKNIVNDKKVIKTIVCYTGSATQKRSNGVEVKPWEKVI